MKIYAKLLGTGSYLPQRIVSNDELALNVDTSDQWIQERTGIKQRHLAAKSETAASMGAAAARNALAAAGLQALDIGMIIVATCTSGTAFPSSACLIQQDLGIGPVPAFDISAACSGFIYAMSIANQFIQSGTIKKILIVGSEIMSRVIDWQDRSTCVLFGDGAGAMVLGNSDQAGLISTHLSADGEQHDLLTLNNLQGTDPSNHASSSPYITMQGNKLFKQAVNLLKKVAIDTIKANDLSVEDLDWLVPHQANIRIIQAMADKLKMPMEKVIVTVGEHGNTSSASIPLALDHGIRSGQIKPGELMLLEAFGGGLTWGSALLRY